MLPLKDEAFFEHISRFHRGHSLLDIGGVERHKQFWEPIHHQILSAISSSALGKYCEAIRSRIVEQAGRKTALVGDVRALARTEQKWYRWRTTASTKRLESRLQETRAQLENIRLALNELQAIKVLLMDWVLAGTGQLVRCTANGRAWNIEVGPMHFELEKGVLENIDFDVYQSLGSEAYNAVNAVRNSLGSMTSAIKAWREFPKQIPDDCPLHDHKTSALFVAAYTSARSPHEVLLLYDELRRAAAESGYVLDFENFSAFATSPRPYQDSLRYFRVFCCELRKMGIEEAAVRWPDVSPSVFDRVEATIQQYGAFRLSFEQEEWETVLISYSQGDYEDQVKSKEQIIELLTP